MAKGERSNSFAFFIYLFYLQGKLYHIDIFSIKNFSIVLKFKKYSYICTRFGKKELQLNCNQY